MYSFLDGEFIFIIEYNYKIFKGGCIMKEGNFLVLFGVDKSGDVFGVY